MIRALLIAYTTYIHDGRVRRHAEALATRGDHVDVICLGSPGRLDGVNVIGLDIPRYRGGSRSSYLNSYFRFFLRATAVAMRLNSGGRYDVVIACTMPDAVVLCTLPLRLLGAKVVLDVHDTMPELYRDKFGGARGAFGARLLMIEERASAALAHRVLAVHESHRERLIQSGIDARKISVVMNSPDSRIFAPRAHPLRDEGFTIVCHGTVTRRLGLDVAIRAIALLRDRISKLRLRIIGDGDYRPEAESLVEALQLKGQVSFLDPVAIDELPKVLREASVGLVPNRASSATHLMLPVKLLEYATLGIPAIASRLKTIERYFGNHAVRYFEPDRETSLAEAIADLYHNPDLRRHIAGCAREVSRRISWASQRGRFYEVIDSLAAGRSDAWPHHTNRGPDSRVENTGDTGTGLFEQKLGGS